MITFDTDPSRYRHWRLACDGPVATQILDVRGRWRDLALDWSSPRNADAY